MNAAFRLARRTLIVALLAVPAFALTFRYTFVSPGGLPSVPIPQYFVVSTTAELPTSSVRQADLAYVKADDTFYKRTATTWTNVDTGGGGGAPTDAEYWVNTAHAGLSAEKVLGTAAGTIEGLCIGQANCTPSSDRVSVGDAQFTMFGNGGEPTIEVDTNDFFRFTRSTNTFDFTIGSIQYAKISSSGLYLSPALAAIYGGTGAGAVTTGDILYGSATDTWSRRGIGSSGQVLTVSGGVPVWATPGAVTISTLQNTYSTTDGLNWSDVGSGGSDLLGFAVAANTKYVFTCELRVTSNDSSTGALLSFNGPASPNIISYWIMQATSATAISNHAETAYDTGTVPNATNTAPLPVHIAGYFNNSSNSGTFVLRLKSSQNFHTVSVQSTSFCISMVTTTGT